MGRSGDRGDSAFRAFAGKRQSASASARVTAAGSGFVPLTFTLTLTLLLGCGPNPVHAPDPLPVLNWPTLLGDLRRAGHAREMPPDSPRVVFSAKAGRGLLAPPIVAPPMIFTGTSNRMVMAFSTDNGGPYWERHIDGAIGKALVAGGGLIFAAGEERDGVTYALEPGRGHVEWSRKLGFAAAAPLLMGDTLVVALEDRKLVALRTKDDGAAAWTARLPAAAAATPVPFGDALVIAARNDSLYLVGRGGGALTGRAPIGGYASGPPALAGDTLYVPVEAGGVVAIRLPSLQRLFRAGGSAPVLAPPAVAADGTVYFLDTSADLWKLPAGSATATRLAALGGAARGAMTLTAGGLLVGKLDGTLTLIGFDGTTRWTVKLDGSIQAPAAVVGGAAYVPLEGGRIVKVR